MCGIFGYFSNTKNTIDHKQVQEMGQKLYHRGPDDLGVFIDKGVALGNRRLSIIDLEGGGQPFYSCDKNVVVVQNGEIFNYIELKNELLGKGHSFSTSSDTEVILKGFEEWGRDVFSKLNGMFAIAIYQKKTDTLILSRDRAGEKPLYWAKHGSHLFFASEIKSILSVASHFSNINQEALSYYLQLGYVPPPFTIFEGINQVLPGHYCEVTPKSFHEKKWWQIQNQIEDVKATDEYFIQEARALFSDAVKIRMRADVSFGAFLSGGVDSSFNVAQMSQWQSQPTDSFNISFPGTKFDEHEQALYAAKKFGTRHHSTTCDHTLVRSWPKFIFHCDQPHADVSFIPTLKVCESAVRNVKMVLTGDGADEIYAGYNKYSQFFEDKSQNPSLPMSELYLLRNSVFDTNEVSSLLGHSSYQNSLNEHLKKQVDQVSNMDDLNKYLFLDFSNLLPGNNLIKPDRMGMAVSLEARTPFMDYRIIEHAFRIPEKFKILNGETKNILKKASLPLLGEEIVYRKKQMFSVPFTEWSDLKLDDIAKNLLLSPHSLSPDVISPTLIKESLNAYKKKPHEYLKKIRTLISLELWLKICVDGSDYQDMERFF